jgi:two-component system, NarL family, sensor kinase
MNRRLYILLILLSGISKALHSQTAMNKDSLLALLPTAKKDTGLVHTYINIGQQYENNNIDSAKYYYWAANTLSKEIKYKKGEIKFISNYTYVLNIEGKLDSSLLLNKQALALANDLNDDELMASARGNIGASFQYLEKPDSAIAYYLLAKNYFERKGKVNRVATLSSNLCVLYQNLEQHEKALEYANEAEKIARVINDRNVLVDILVNKSNPLLDLKKFEEAKKVLEEAMQLSKAINNDYAYSVCLLNMGDLNIKTAQYGQVKKYAEEALLITENIGNADGHCISLRALGIYYFFHEKEYATAEKYTMQSYNEAIANKSLKDQYSAILLLSDIATAKQDLMGHHAYRVRADSIESIINRETMNKTIENFTTQYETEKKETLLKLQTAEIKNKKNLIYLLGSISAALLILGFTGYRNYRHRQSVQQLKISELEKEKQLTATEAVLKGEEQERTRLAKDLHDGLGGMLSGIKYNLNTMKGNLVMTPDNAMAFERSVDMLDSSIQEMRRVAHNMMPEVLVKFGLDTALEQFCSDINQSGALKINYQSMGLKDAVIEQTTAITIYRIVQELINNTIKHAGASTALVQVNKTDGTLSVTVEDNGKGFDTALLSRAKGIGWTNIQHRVDFLKGKLDVQSGAGNGTFVHIEI